MKNGGFAIAKVFNLEGGFVEWVVLLLSILTTLKYKNNLISLIISITVAFLGLLLFVKPLTSFFEFETLNFAQLGISIGTGFLFVIWYEGVKWGQRNKVA